MSQYKVPLTTIKEIIPHGNADSLEVAKVYDFEVIIRKGQYKIDDIILYIPIDSIIPQWLENKLFPPDSKIKLNKRRVKQIKIRGRYSQGLIVNKQDLEPPFSNSDCSALLETDLAQPMGIEKYEPGPAPFEGSNTSVKRDKPKENPYFHKYGGLDNFKWYPDLFKEGEMVSVTEKIHGSNIRFGFVPYVANNLWRKFLKFLGLAPEYEWVYGSNNVQLQQRSNFKGFYGEDVYGKVLEKYDAKSKVKPGEIFYGELYGDGIQKGYTYGCKKEHNLVLFDLKIQKGTESHFLNTHEFQQIATERGFDVVPELYCGPYDKEKIRSLTIGDSVFESSQKVREGVVIKPLVETECSIGRKVLKLISEKYLESDQTDFH